MKTIESYAEPLKYEYKFPQPKEEILFFDIETTGLVPNVASICIIGAMYFDSNADAWHLRQFFADDYKSEELMLKSFLEMLDGFKYLYHFNGKAFDIPFILSKCKKYGISLNKHCAKIFSDSSGRLSLDLLALIRPLKKTLSIEKTSQSALEQWLGITRDDACGADMLAKMYSEYMQIKIISPQKAPELEKRLLAHNRDDLAHMRELCGILSYKKVFSDEHDILISKIVPSDGFINIHFTHGANVPKKTAIKKGYPKSVIFSRDGEESKNLKIPAISDASILIEKNSGILSAPVMRGTLKRFYNAYGDYYYIKEKDMALHKSLCGPADKKNNKKASASTCYVKSEGVFVPSLTLRGLDEKTPRFYITYHDRLCFYMLPEGPIDEKKTFWRDFTLLQLSAVM